MSSRLSKIISGGQTGVDRAALDAALAAGIPCGGWCPADRGAEDGPIPDRYALQPFPGWGNRKRTRQNVIDSDATVILHFEALKGGTRLTRNLCALEKKPYLLLDARQFPPAAAAQAVSKFIEESAIQTLNVAGPRLSGWAGGYAFALAVMSQAISLTMATGGQRQ
jgi:Circularly permutated YpsA SLOG family